MRKDLKTGLVIGLALALCALVVISVLPSGTVKSRLRYKVSQEQDSASAGEQKNSEPKPHKPQAQPAKVLSPANEEEITDEEPKPVPQEILRFHEVTSGQTLSSISMIYYGNTDGVKKISDANPQISDINKLRPGMRLIIPE